MRTLPMTLAAMLLAACSTPQERAAYQQAQAAEMVTVYGPACSQLGYTPNTDQWRACLLALSNKEDMRYYLNTPYYGPGYYRGGGWWGPW